MPACPCRKRTQKKSKVSGILFAEQNLMLRGSDFQTLAGWQALLNTVLPAGVALPGTPYCVLPSDTGYTLNPNTSNNPEPLVPAGITYNTPAGIWGASARLFIQDNMENLATHFSDVKQGTLGDCWCLAAIAALAAYGNMANGTSVIEQAFASISPAGAANPTSVTINLYRPDAVNYGRTTAFFAQTVDTQIPVLSSNRAVVPFVQSDAPGEYWPCMMEKAVAAALTTTRNGVSLTGYPAVEGGCTPVGMSFFTPGIPVVYDWTGASPPTAAQLYTAWDAVMAKGITVCANWKPNSTNANYKGNFGLITGHAYTVYSIVNAGGFKLALFRNPWGKGSCQYNQQSNDGEWTGAWSDCSPQWAANPIVKAACGFSGPRSDGLFWMSFDDIALNLAGYQLFIPDRADMRAVDLRTSPFVGCSLIPDWDYGGTLAGTVDGNNNIKATAGECCASCKATPGCVGWNWVGPTYTGGAAPGGCWLKGSITSEGPHTGVISGRVERCANVNCGAHGTCIGGTCYCKDGYSGAQCQTAPVCNVINDWDFGGAGLTDGFTNLTDTADQCCAQCKSTPGCVGWNWVGPFYTGGANQKGCWLKSSITSEGPHTGVISGKI